MRHWLVSCLVAVSGFGLGCTPAEEPFDPEEIGRDVLAVLEQFKSSTQAGDIEAVGEFYCDPSNGDVIWFEEGDLAYPDRDALLKSLAGITQFGPVSTVFTDQQVTALSAGVAWLSTRFNTSVGEPGSDRAFQFGGVMTVLMQRVAAEDGAESWCALRGHTSSRQVSAEGASPPDVGP